MMRLEHGFTNIVRGMGRGDMRSMKMGNIRIRSYKQLSSDGVENIFGWIQIERN